MEIIILTINDFTKKVKKEEKKEEKLPAYVVPISNFSANNAYVYGVPCKVIQGQKADDDDIIVMSLITGIRYTIPKGWYIGYDNEIDAIRASSIERSMYGKPQLLNIIGKKYYPKDNSYITDFKGRRVSLVGKTVTVVSLPFDETIESYGITRKMILVEYEGKVYRTMFMEWAFFPKTENV